MFSHPYFSTRGFIFFLFTCAQACTAAEEPVPVPGSGETPVPGSSAMLDTTSDSQDGRDARVPSALPDSALDATTHDAESHAGADAASDGTTGITPVPDVPYRLQEVEANGYVFNVWVAGPEDGEVVLLLHGFPETSYEWRYVVPELVARGYRVIAPDQRGYSPKARPIDDREYAVILLAQDAIAIADAFSARAFHLVGHDWGGGVAWLVARLVPLRTLSMTAVGTPHPDAMDKQLNDTTSCQHEASAYFDKVTEADAAARFVEDPRTLIENVEQDPIPDLDAYADLHQSEEAMHAALAWYRANIEDRRFNTLTLGAIDTPTLLVLGDQELFFCRDTAEMSGSYVDASFQFELIESVGHWIPEQKSAIFTELLLSHMRQHAGRVRGATPAGADPERPLGAGSSGFACRGAPDFEIPSELSSCDDLCAQAHCMPASTLGDGAETLPACPSSAGAGLACVPDVIASTLGRFSLVSCTPWLPSGPAVCVPRCLAGSFGFVLGRDGCAEGELCAPCDNPLTGEATGACADRCQGL